MPNPQRPDRLSAARLPTPIESLSRVVPSFTDGGGDLWVKRDDQTGFVLGGNKIRKLEYSFAEAKKRGADTVLTCGGFDSNHCRATTYFARRHGLEPILLLRTPDGKPVSDPQGNTLLNQIADAKIEWVTPDEYRRGVPRLEESAERHRSEGRNVFVIPEGASDALGALGFVHAAEELAEQERSLDRPFDIIVHAVGSGGTSAGLQAGRDALDRPWEIWGVPVCDDGAYFREKVTEIRAGLCDLAGLPEERPGTDHYIEGAQGRGYGLSTPEELRAAQTLAREEGILVDPCYTGKAWCGLLQAIESGDIPRGARVLFWHTGGAFANFSHASSWGEVLG